MRITWVLAAAVLATGAGTAGVGAPIVSPPVVVPAAPPGAGRVSVLHVASADRDVAVRDVWVYRPAVPDSASLPVVYFLHGVPGSASDLFQAGVASVLDRMFASGVPPFVLAAPTGSGDAHGDTEWADSVDGRDLVERYVVDQVIPAVEGAHRRDRMHRIIAGFSMGGFGAANLALRHPDVFGAAASISGYFHIDDPDEVFGANSEVEDRNDPEVLVTRTRNVQFWLAVGDHDDEPVVRGETQRFAALLGNRLDPDDLVVAPGTHSIGFVVSQFPALGAFVAKVSGSLGNGAIRPG